MKSILISLSIICAVTWTVDAIECFQCVKANSDTCVGESVNCPNMTQCMVVFELFQLGNTYHSIKRDCNPGFPCGGLYSSTLNDATVRLNIRCCTKDNCNTDDYKMPPGNIERKGKICPVCSGAGFTECISNDTEQCFHPSDLCVDYIGKIKDPGNNIRVVNYKGCISPLACKYKFNPYISVKEIENKRFNCISPK
ncbi:phospholipase A2 inhibitor gamma subunit B-like [Mixophyes fleayi]|uniref:phospholipase A2 inhibitor gamma subunit B-like n=1 Tax=Mixophyes fleayi TaxID=3061075 RepID=UPI003F4D7CE3